MQIEYYLAFVAATIVVLAVPGPTILLVVSYGLSRGRRSLGAVVAGVVLGDFTAMTLSLAGVGAMLSASAEVFTVLKWLGGAYLIYLGLSKWRAAKGGGEHGQALARRSERRVFAHAYVVTALNPKSIVFFVAFAPQFIQSGAPLLPQLVILEATFLVLAGINAALYGLFADRMGRFFRKPGPARAMERICGTTLVGAGIWAIGSER